MSSVYYVAFYYFLFLYMKLIFFSRIERKVAGVRNRKRGDFASCKIPTGFPSISETARQHCVRLHFAEIRWFSIRSIAVEMIRLQKTGV